MAEAVTTQDSNSKRNNIGPAYHSSAPHGTARGKQRSRVSVAHANSRANFVHHSAGITRLEIARRGGISTGSAHQAQIYIRCLLCHARFYLSPPPFQLFCQTYLRSHSYFILFSISYLYPGFPLLLSSSHISPFLHHFLFPQHTRMTSDCVSTFES